MISTILVWRVQNTYKAAFDVDAELIAGGGGIFDVVVDGERIYCKHESDKFPDEGEIVGLLKARG